jgi:hypothetical protein
MIIGKMIFEKLFLKNGIAIIGRKIKDNNALNIGDKISAIIYASIVFNISNR